MSCTLCLAAFGACNCCWSLVLCAWTGKLAQCCYVETRDNERVECEKRLRELEELIGHEESEVETKQAARGEMLAHRWNFQQVGSSMMYSKTSLTQTSSGDRPRTSVLT